MMFLHYIMYTVNYDNFFEFGVDTGDAELNGDISPPITLPTPIQLFGRTDQTFSVSQLYILSLSFEVAFNGLTLIITEPLLHQFNSLEYLKASTYCRGHSHSWRWKL